MAVYATLAQAEALYGSAYIAVACDRDLDGTVDGTSFDKHLSTASRQIDMYIMGHYPLPLATPPEHLQKVCVDIAVYNAVPSADVRTDEMRKRYEDAIRTLELIAQGKLKLETSTDTSPGSAMQAATIETRSELSLVECSRTFGISKTRGIL